METVIPYGSPQAAKVYSQALFSASMQRPTMLNRLAGRMPQNQTQAESNLRFESSNEYPIVRVTDLERTAGDEVIFDLINNIGGKPIMGERYAEGKGTPMSFSQDSLRINQTRKPISAGGQMTQQRTPHRLRTLARALAFNYMTRLEDQLILVHLAGARGFDYNIEWAVPLESDPDFNEIVVNEIKPPTRNRHFIAGGGGIALVGQNAGEIGIQTTDVMTADTIDAMRVTLDSMVLPPPYIRFDDDRMADDAPLRVLLCSPAQYASIVTSGDFRTWQANAMQRARAAKDNPLFMGEAGLWNGILIVKMPKPIRFYAGDVLQYNSKYDSSGLVSDAVVPAAFGTEYAVDRALLLGGQALAEAYGSVSRAGLKTRNSYFWSEKELDHDDKLEVLVGMIGGKSKFRFEVDYGVNNTQETDHGVIAIDTAVRIPAL